MQINGKYILTYIIFHVAFCTRILY